MSTLTSVTLITSTASYSQHDCSLVQVLNERLQEGPFYLYLPFTQVSACSTIKQPDFIDEQYFVGCVTNFDEEDFRKLMRKIPWMYPEDIQVFIRSEHDRNYRELEYITANQIEQSPVLIYNPANGVKYAPIDEDEPAPSWIAQDLREHNMIGAWLFNPWTGELRDSFEVLNDPLGREIDPPLHLETDLGGNTDMGITLGADNDYYVGMVVAKSIEVTPGFIHITDLPPEYNIEQAIDFIMAKPNPDRLPIKVFPEPAWWNDFIQS